MLNKFVEMFQIACKLIGMVINQIPFIKLPNLSLFEHEQNVIFQHALNTNAFFMNKQNDNDTSSNTTSIALARIKQVIRHEDEIIDKSRKRKIDSIHSNDDQEEEVICRYNLRSRRI